MPQLHNVLEAVEKFPSTTSMHQVLLTIYHNIAFAVEPHRKGYDIPPLHRFDVSYAPWRAQFSTPSLLRDGVTYGVQKANQKPVQLPEKALLGDLSSCFLCLSELDQLSATDVKERRIPMRVQIMVSQLIESAANNTIPISSSDDEDQPRRSKRGRFVHSDDEHEEEYSSGANDNGDDSSDVNTAPTSEAPEPPLKVRISSSQIQSLTSRRPTKTLPSFPLRTIGVECVDTSRDVCTDALVDQQLPPTPATSVCRLSTVSPPLNSSPREATTHTKSLLGPSHPEGQAGSRIYKSLYRPNKLMVSANKIQFTNFEIRRTTATVSEDGDIFNSEAVRVETIGIAKQWRAGSEHGLVGKGQFKQVVTALYNSKLYAIAWFHPRTSQDALTHDENKSWLFSEFQLLHLGEFMMNSFYRRACAFNVKIPNMKFHTEGSFMAEISSRTLPEFLSTERHEALEKESVPTNHFLATVLLPTKGEPFEKFSGTEEAGHGTTALGRALDAFAHHTLIESAADMVFVDLQGAYDHEGTFCLADPQAHR
ncbi:hypothetical protein BOTBODRAFT_176025 [Botryobasidium botryosum FD-172 SS1]|uniref:Alpha-type protein kinase domain-containing protein n=1 Tax=Botryobasidium botryosum (strain FD-172 SS1) TaxID=930990 RepID=A0A067MM01_BOTB1|nr:hypothetical protein BOTBODRAFT_176025 [Botryobasidium botryosum FD-172 SS1]